MKIFYPTTTLFTALLFTCLLLALCGCHEKATVMAEPNVNLKPIKEAKPGAAIRLISNTIVSIKAKQTSQFELIFDVGDSEGLLNIKLSPTEGLDVVDTQMIQSIKLSSANTIKIPVTLHAAIDGRYYLNIQATVEKGDSLSSRNLALIVQVGAEKEKANVFKKASGENVISLPAQETISNK